MQLNQQTPTIVRPLIPGITHQLIINGTFHFARLDIFTSHDGVSFELLDISPIDKPGTYPLTHPTHTTYKIALRSATPQTSIDLTIPTSLEPVSITYLETAPSNADSPEGLWLRATNTNPLTFEDEPILTADVFLQRRSGYGSYLSADGLWGLEIDENGVSAGVDFAALSYNGESLAWEGAGPNDFGASPEELAEWVALSASTGGSPLLLEAPKRTKTTGTFALFNGQLYANHGTNEAPDFHPIIKSDIKQIVSITQAAYDILSPPDAETLYLITE